MFWGFWVSFRKLWYNWEPMEEQHIADMAKDRTVTTASRWSRVNRVTLLRVLSGLIGALLFVVFVTRGAFPASAASLVVGLLVVALAATIAVQPPIVRVWRRVVAWPGLGHTALVAGVVAIGSVLRFWGLRFGLPYLDHPDEWAVADRAVAMLQTADYNPRSFIYPTLYTYLQVPVAGMHFIAGVGAGLYETVDDIDPAHYYVWGRGFTALLGSATVLLTYVLGRLWYGPMVGLLAALFLAVYPSAVGDAHYITTDTPSMFFTLLAFLPMVWMALRPPERHTDRLALTLIAGFCVGLAMATKYNVVVLIVPLLVALVAMARSQRAPKHPRYTTVLVGSTCSFVGVALGFTLGTPFWISELPNVLNDVASVLVHYRFTGHPGAESSQSALFYWGAFLNESALVAWAGFGGLVLAFVRRRTADVLLLSFAVLYFIQMSGVTVVFFRNAMPFLPFLCLLAAMAVMTLIDAYQVRVSASPESPKRAIAFSPHPVVLVALFAVLFSIQPFSRAVYEDWLRARPTTRILATEWVEQNAPDGSRIWLEDQTLILSDRLQVQGGQPMTSNPLEWYQENGFRYLVVNDDVAANAPEQLAPFGEPVAEFVRDDRYGPLLSIYATGVGDVADDERTPSGATLGGGTLVLDGYRHAGEVQAGTALQLALYWQVTKSLTQDYVVYVHLVDDEDTKVAQRDVPPLNGSRPTSSWQAGELIRDDQDLPVSGEVAPGTYRLLVGMYDPQTLTPLNDAGPIELGKVVVR
ncbi:MAG: phospholipid carrier-dependent glycosyltransferase [Chloroflexi bacterium AL-N1]|nr:phospholipid carrier-dependent glycosyltransferase [Chloroflexi bacterium AL-N1]